ncbi:MAG: hypothetical protein HZB51_02605 [Chloroflexi bacterium]|nr:hypothetical protein [Chloroflexota bacterium]
MLKNIGFLLFPLFLLFASGCGNVAQPASPTPTVEAQRNPNIDMQPALREFLANLPADWHLVASQEVVRASPFIIDVRQPDEYRKGFIAGAINIPLRTITRNLQSLPGMDKDIVVVCDTGHRSAVGMAILQMLGYKRAKTLDGGMQSWQTAKLPIVTEPIPPPRSAQPSNVNPKIQAMLDYYLAHTLPYDWGIIDADGLTADQKLLPSSSAEAQPETYDQGASLIIDVNTPAEFGESSLKDFQRAINVPLRELPDALDRMPLQETIDWA